MKDTKSVLRHEILNILTLISFSVSDSKLDQSKKSEIDDWIKLINLLIAHEDVIFDKKPKLFLRENNLNEILEIIMAIIKDKLTKIKITLPENDLHVKIDRNLIKECLEQIIKKLLESSTEIECVLCDKKNQLIIIHNSKDKLNIKKKSFVKFLNKKDFMHSEIPFQFALNVLDIHKAKITSSKNKIVITFPG